LQSLANNCRHRQNNSEVDFQFRYITTARSLVKGRRYAPMAIHGEVVLRLRICCNPDCHELFTICTCCDRGQRYAALRVVIRCDASSFARPIAAFRKASRGGRITATGSGSIVAAAPAA
jgi:hypothetical protein